MLIRHPDYQKTLNALIMGRSFLVIGHQKPDGDALGSMVALGLYLESSGKEVQYLAMGGVTENRTETFMPKVKEFCADPSELKHLNFDQVVILDSGDLVYAGVDDFIKDLRQQKDFKLVNIDHHATNPDYGDVDLVIPNACSTCEVLFNLFKQNQITISADQATALLNGLVFDTGSFSNSATSLTALQAAYYLLHLGAKQSDISISLLKNKELNLLKIWGKVLARLTINLKYNLAYTVILPNDFIEFEQDENSTDGLANFLNELSGVNATMVLKQTADGQIKGSFRTTRNDVNVAKVARLLGGGGHVGASGFRLKGRLVCDNNKWRVI